MNLINGTDIAFQLKTDLSKRVTALQERGVIPGLATILVGDDPASHVYVGSKIKACEALGIQSFHYPLPVQAEEREVLDVIEQCNANSSIHGILLQLPLPAGMSGERCVNRIMPTKDVDGLHPCSVGVLVEAKSWNEIERKKLLAPCTPLGIIHLLKTSGISIEGKHAVVVGRSNLVGKPIAMMLLANNATVTMAHSRTKDLAAMCRQADILVAAIGKPKFVTPDYVKDGAVVIDVGINRTKDGLCGDVDFDAVQGKSSAITPVPRGVGPMTIAMLMRNTIVAAEKTIR